MIIFTLIIETKKDFQMVSLGCFVGAFFFANLRHFVSFSLLAHLLAALPKSFADVQNFF